MRIFFLILLLTIPLRLPAQSTVALLHAAFSRAAQRVAPAVVHIMVTRSRDITPPKQALRLPERIRRLPKKLRRYWEFFSKRYRLQQRRHPYFQRPKGGTSGVLIDPQGQVLTSYYNIAGEVQKIVVTLADRREFPARILGVDKLRDLALLQIKGSDLPAVPLQSSSDLKIGAWALVVGRGISGPDYTLNIGIVSSVHRFKERAIQIDAKVNYANAGGALVDIHGRLIGIVNHLSSYERAGQSTGVGFATPAAEILKVLPFLQQGRTVPPPRVPFLGIRADLSSTANAAQSMVVIAKVYPHSGAAKAGLQPKDIILTVDGIKIKSLLQLGLILRTKKIGSQIKLTIQRGRRIIAVSCTLGSRQEKQ